VVWFFVSHQHIADRYEDCQEDYEGDFKVSGNSLRIWFPFAVQLDWALLVSVLVVASMTSVTMIVVSVPVSMLLVLVFTHRLIITEDAVKCLNMIRIRVIINVAEKD